MGDDEVLKVSRNGLEEGSAWDLLPLLEYLHAGKDRRVNIVHGAQLEHAASEVIDVEELEGGSFTVRQHAFGLVDSASPLPEAYVDLAVREAHSEVGGPWLDLLNSLTQPFVLSDWRAWRRRFAGITEGHALPPLALALERGCGEDTLSSALAASGFLAHGVFSSGVLSTALSNLLDADCTVEEFQPEWMAIDQSDFSKLGQNVRLGFGLLGTRALAADGAATLRIKSGLWEDVEDLLRDSRSSTVGKLLALASEARISWTVEMTSVRIPASTRVHLDRATPRADMTLGVSSWLTSSGNMPSDYNCSVRIPQFGAWTGD